MKVVLYRKCILNSNYTEVFRNKELIDNYLNTLGSFTFNDVKGAYIKLNDILQIGVSNYLLDLFDYNYMTVEDDFNNKFYCFIDNIDCGNKICSVTYTVDVWSTFNDKWNLRKSYITNSRKLIAGEPYDLPIHYIGNDGLDLLAIQQSPSYNNFMSILIEFQPYELSSGGDSIDKNTIVSNKTSLIAKAINGSSSSLVYRFTYEEVDEIIDDIIRRQSNKSSDLGVGSFIIPDNFTQGSTLQAYFYRVVNIYVIPYDYISNLISDGRFSLVSGIASSYNNTTNNYYWKYMQLSPTLPIYNEIVNQYTISANTTIKSVGFFTLQVPYNFNGKDKIIEIWINYDNYTFNIYMNYENGFNEVTELFRYEKNFDVVEASALEQQRIQRELGTIKGVFGIVNGVTDVAVGVGTMAVGGAQIGAGGAVTSAKGASNVVGGAGGIIGGIQNIVLGIKQIEYANAKKYNNAMFTNNYNNSKLNATFGICARKLYTQNSIINYDIVNKAIEEMGYNVNYFTDDIDLGQTITDYNILKFSFIRINGCTSIINNMIENILINGVKIWYTINVG